MSQPPSTPVKVPGSATTYTAATLDPDIRSQINAVLLRDGHISKYGQPTTPCTACTAAPFFVKTLASIIDNERDLSPCFIGKKPAHWYI